jgi:N-acetylglucosamine-6-phosphate deacetylase
MMKPFACSSIVTPGGSFNGRFDFDGAAWEHFTPGSRSEPLESSMYCVAGTPVDFHCHGVGPYDFSEMAKLDLERIDEILEREGVACIMTLYLERRELEEFVRLVHRLKEGHDQKRYRNILGIALEGPMLTSPGGTPLSTVWAPTRDEWRLFASLGTLGLKYMVLSPDAMNGENGADFFGGNNFPASLEWIVDTLLDGGVVPALGHFRKDDPQRSARSIRTCLEVAAHHNVQLVSDHLFNDMPRNFKHAWRTEAEKRVRIGELSAQQIHRWNWDELDAQLGVVPATLMRAARDNRISLCLNFDGDHVDLAISTRVIELLGGRNLIGMTDRVHSMRLGGRDLMRTSDNSLLYQDAGLVAAGTQDIERQVENLARAGVAPDRIWNMFVFQPRAVLDLHDVNAMPPRSGFLVVPGSPRQTFQA